MASFAPEVVFQLGQLPVTNTLLNSLLVDVVLIGGAFFITRNMSRIPNLVQSGAEMIIESFYSLIESVADKRAAYIFPYFATFFLFILISNWSGLLPGVGSIGIFHESHDHGKELIPLMRSATSDVNATFALAIISAVATHVLSIRLTGIKDYLSRYFSLNPINLFIGFLEIISEITKVVSLSFRLFGNIFAGEVVLGTVAKIFAFSAFLIPLPFMMLEVIVGLVQALVFSMLTFVFMAILTTPHHHAAKEVSH